MREGWNFHNDISLKLENDARRLFKMESVPREKVFNADGIDTGHFVETMIILLRRTTDYNNYNEEIDNFINKSSKYIGNRANSIPEQEAEDLYATFKSILKSIEDKQ